MAIESLVAIEREPVLRRIIKQRAGIAAITAAGLVIALALVAGVLLMLNSASGAVQDKASCGQVVNGTHYDAAPILCLWRAYQARQPARGVMTDLTVEGDPVIYTVAIMRAAVQVSVQSQDRFGPQGSFSYSCSGLTQKLATNGSGHVYLVATGCQGPPGYVDDSGQITIP